MSELDNKEIQELRVDFNEYYSDEDIQRRLSNLPRLRYAQGRIVLDAYVAFKEAENQHKRIMASQHLIARQKKDLTSDGDRKSWALNSMRVATSEKKLLSADLAHKNAQLKYDALDDIFTAVRKLASMRMAENEDQKNEAKYGRTHQ